MKLFIVASVLCAIALARPDGYQHGRNSVNKLNGLGHHGKGVQEYFESQKISDQLEHHHSTLSYAPTVPYHTHSTPATVEGYQHLIRHVSPSAQSSQYVIKSVDPAKLHYQKTVHTPSRHYKAPVAVQSHFHGHDESHYAIPAYRAQHESHYESRIPTQGESHHGIVESIVNSGHFEPAYNSNEVVHKHVSVHVPHQEEEQSYVPIIQYQPAQKNKHYKIVFVKAPSAQPKAPVIHVPNVQNEEKTLVYVLAKKPEGVPDIVLPEPKPTKVNKPEVFYINYEAEKKDNKHEVHSDEVVAAIDSEAEHSAHAQRHQHEEQNYHHHNAIQH